jgi:hypothetical protein
MRWVIELRKRILGRFPAHLILGVSVALIFIGISIHYILFGLNNPAPDFLVYWQTSKFLLTGDIASIYKLAGPMVFRYSPFTLFVFAPLGLFSLIKARIIWIFLQLLACFLSIALMSITAKKIFKLSVAQTSFSAALVALLICRYYVANLHSGQITPFSVAFGAAGLFFWFRGQLRIAATLLVARSFFKIVPVIWLVPVVLIQGTASIRLILFGTIISLLLGGALSAAFMESDEFALLPKEWIGLVFSHHEQYRSATTYSQSLPSVILRAIEGGLVPRDVYWPLLICASLGILLLAFRTWWKIDVEATSAQLGVFASVSLLVRLIAPDNFPYANMPLLFPLFYFVGKSWTSAEYRRLLTFFVVTVSIPGKDTLHPFLFDFYRGWSIPFFCRLVTFVAFLRLLYQDESRSYLSLAVEKSGLLRPTPARLCRSTGRRGQAGRAQVSPPEAVSASCGHAWLSHHSAKTQPTPLTTADPE